MGRVCELEVMSVSKLSCALHHLLDSTALRSPDIVASITEAVDHLGLTKLNAWPSAAKLNTRVSGVAAVRSLLGSARLRAILQAACVVAGW